LTVLSAPAGFGKTTLVSEWAAGCRGPIAWLSLDEADNDPSRFITYLISALQTIQAGIGESFLAALQSPQPPQTEAILTALLNEISDVSGHFLLVLDDFHTVDSQAVDQALTFLVEHQPPEMHLVIATRQDPSLPLARLRARGHLTELRAADLRFIPAEAAEFLNAVMGLSLSAEDIAALDARTEGWIAGLQMAALSMQGLPDAAGFIQSFTGSHRFVLDYLLEEVLQRQPGGIQHFLLCTSILERLSGPLCEAVLGTPPGAGQSTLEELEHANLFLVPLDNERHWYRYHHLFGDLLRQRLIQSRINVTELHVRASRWHEDNNLVLEAFRHAAAADDIERAERLMENKKMPLHLRDVAAAVLNWLASLSPAVLDSNPLLRVRFATLTLMTGQTTGVEQTLQAAEPMLQNSNLDDKTRDLIGQIAAARATLALTRYKPEAIVPQSRRALEYLDPHNLPFRFTAMWTLAFAFHLLGDRAAAIRSYSEAIAISQASGDVFSTLLATSGLGQVQELENQLYKAAETYRSVLPLFGDHPLPAAAEVYLGLARICYEWNDLESADRHGQLSLQLAGQYDRVIDRFIISEVFLARLKLARGDVDGASALLAQAEGSARRQNFVLRIPDIAAAQVLVLLRQGNLDEAAHLAQSHELPISRVRVLLAQGDAPAALSILEPFCRQMKEKGWEDERLRALVLQALALDLKSDKVPGMETLAEALSLAEPGGFIRLFVDEGEPMRSLMLDLRSSIEKQSGAAAHPRGGYVDKLLLAFAQPADALQSKTGNLKSKIVESLTRRELEVLNLIAQGCSNQDISRQLFLALDTVKGHNRRIFDKLQVKSRTEAIARARELGLI